MNKDQYENRLRSLEDKLFFVEIDIENTENSLAHLKEVAQKYREHIKKIQAEYGEIK